jgi:hypothetical protein
VTLPDARIVTGVFREFLVKVVLTVGLKAPSAPVEPLLNWPNAVIPKKEITINALSINLASIPGLILRDRDLPNISFSSNFDRIL